MRRNKPYDNHVVPRNSQTQKKSPIRSAKPFRGLRYCERWVAIESLPLEQVVNHFAYIVENNGFGYCLQEPYDNLHSTHLLSDSRIGDRGGDSDILQLRQRYFNLQKFSAWFIMRTETTSKSSSSTEAHSRKKIPHQVLQKPFGGCACSDAIWHFDHRRLINQSSALPTP